MHTADPETQLKAVLPISFLQNDVGSHAQDLQAIMILRIKLVQLRQRIVKHSKFCIPLRNTDFLFEGHW